MFGVLSSVLEAAAEYTKYKYKNKKPVEFEEWQARQREIDDSIAKGDTKRISGFFERMRRKSSGGNKIGPND